MAHIKSANVIAFFEESTLEVATAFLGLVTAKVKARVAAAEAAGQTSHRASGKKRGRKPRSAAAPVATRRRRRKSATATPIADDNQREMFAESGAPEPEPELVGAV
jgi:hypothetical protein